MTSPGFGPPSLPVGTEVSAKYRGAFCEATVKTVIRVVKCKVVMKDCQTSICVIDEEIKGQIMLGSVVEVKHPETGQPVEATINKLIDHSTYTVVFDDGDERTLRRSQLCLKGDKHFIESETLDNLPLSHPEHFGTPVLQNKKSKRKTDDESENEEEEESEEESPRRAMYRGRHQELVGKLMLVDFPNRKGSMIPTLVVLPDANSLNEVKNRDQILVRSFKDGKFMTVVRKMLKDFSRVVAIKNDDKTMRTAFEKALLYYDTKELPVGWNKEEMLGSDLDDEEGDSGDADEYASEDEPFEEKDRFVAQLYKFMDERGTPINKGPCIANKDLNLYKLFKIVEKLGGYNKVTKEMKWPVVYSKMGLPSLHQNPAHQIRTAYKKYLDAFETFYRKLGSTMGTMSRPGRSRQNSGGRSILNPRTKDKSPRIPKPEKVTQNKDEAEKKQKSEPPVEKTEEKDNQDAVSVASTDDGDVVTRRTPRRDGKGQTSKEESKVQTSKEESKVQTTTKEESKVQSPKDEGKVQTPKEDPKLQTPKDQSKLQVSKEVVKAQSPKDQSKAQMSKEVSKMQTPKDQSKVQMPKEDIKLQTPKEQSKVMTPKEESKLPTPKDESKDKKEDIEKVKKDEPLRMKKEDTPSKAKREDPVTPKSKKEEDVGSATKSTKKEEPAKMKKEDDSLKKEERKSTRKLKGEDEKDSEKDEKKLARGGKKAKEDEKKEEIKVEAVTPVKDSPKKRVTRHKIILPDLKKEAETKEDSEDKKDQPKKAAVKDTVKTLEKKDKEMSGTHQRRDSRSSDKTEVPVKSVEKKQVPCVEKKLKMEEKKAKKDKKGKEDEDEELSDDNSKAGSQSAGSDEGEGSDQEKSDSSGKHDYPIGSKLRVKYGKGKNQKIYIAKVVDFGKEGSHKTYLVHYAGWNTRYDEWIRSDRVVSVLDRPDGMKVKTSLAKSPVLTGFKKTTILTEEDAKTLSTDDKPGQVFRTPKLFSAKTRATRSSSSDTSVASKRLGKRLAGRRSGPTDSTGSQSPESNTSSDMEGASGSDPADDEDNMKEENAEEEDVLDVEEFEETEDESVKGKSMDTSIETDLSPSEGLASEAGSERVEEEEEEEETKSDKEIISVEQLEESNHDTDTQLEGEHGQEVNDLLPEDVSKQVLDEKLCSTIKSPVTKRERASVSVAEVKDAVDEIKPAAFYNDGDIKMEDNCPEDSEVKVISAASVEVELNETSKLEIVEKEVEQKETKTDLLEPETESQNLSLLPGTSDQSIPQLKKVNFVETSKGQDLEKLKTGRGKKNTTKEKTAKASDTPSTSLVLEIPTLEPMSEEPLPAMCKLEPSPYDFDAEVETPWQPEITKKWEPNQKIVAPVKDLASEEGDVKEKKKVKKKAKKKSVSPERPEQVSAVAEDAAGVLDDSVIAPVSEEIAIEIKGRKKKGRKKKDLVVETKKEVIESYESTVNSVVEAVKHSLQETESDQEQRSSVKRRRVKRFSEGDKKDSATRVTKAGRKVASKDVLDVAESSKPALDILINKPDFLHSLSTTESVLLCSVQPEDIPGTSSSAVVAEEIFLSKDIKKESSFGTSQGFSPVLDREPSATFDNTPPTTPEHEQEANAAAMQQQEDQYHSVDESCKIDHLRDKDNLKISSSSFSSSSTASLPVSSAAAPSKSASESPSDNDVISTTSTDNMDATLIAQHSESSGTDQDIPSSKKRKVLEENLALVIDLKKRRVHGTRSRTAKKSPKYTGNVSDSHASMSNTPSHCPDSPPSKLDLSKSPRPSKFNFSADLGEYLEGEARCNFLISKMREIKTIYMNLKSEVASIDRRRKRARRKEKESCLSSSNDKDSAT